MQQQRQPNQNRNHMATLLVVLGAVVCSGCETTNTAPVPPTASLEQFMAIRFTGSSRWARVGDSYRYLAYFNQINYRHLELPTQQIYSFCKSGGGNMTYSNRYQGDPLGKFFVSPAAMAAGTAAYARRNGYSDAVALGAADNIWRDATDLNNRFDEKGSRAAYNAVIRNGAYADWHCSYETNSSKNWSVSIRPIGFAPKKTDNLLSPESNNKLVIEIVPIRRTEEIK